MTLGLALLLIWSAFLIGALLGQAAEKAHRENSGR